MTGVLNKFKQPIIFQITWQSIPEKLLQLKDEIKRRLNTLEVETITNKILNNLPTNQEPKKL